MDNGVVAAEVEKVEAAKRPNMLQMAPITWFALSPPSALSSTDVL